MEKKTEELFTRNARILKVRTHVSAQEGPNDRSSTEDRYYEVETLHAGRNYGDREYGFSVKKVEDEAITVSCFGEVITVELGGGGRTASLEEHPPYMVRYITYVTFEYAVVEPRERFIDFIFTHLKKYDTYLNTKGLDGDMKVAKELVDLHIKDGWIELYPMKALLYACPDWKRMKICDEPLYAEIMREGFRNHCLRSKSEIARNWIAMARVYNDLNRIFFNDIVLQMYYK